MRAGGWLHACCSDGGRGTTEGGFKLKHVVRVGWNVPDQVVLLSSCLLLADSLPSCAADSVEGVVFFVIDKIQ